MTLLQQKGDEFLYGGRKILSGSVGNGIYPVCEKMRQRVYFHVESGGAGLEFVHDGHASAQRDMHENGQEKAGVLLDIESVAGLADDSRNMTVQRIIPPECHEGQMHEILEPGRITYGNVPAGGRDQRHFGREQRVALSAVGQHVLLSQKHVHVGLVIGTHQLPYGLRAYLYGDLGITQLEVAQERRKIVCGDAVVGGNDDVAANFFSPGNLFAYLLKQSEQLLAQNIELFAGRREFQRYGTTIDQLYTESLFEFFQLIGLCDRPTDSAALENERSSAS